MSTKNVYKRISNDGINWNDLKHIQYILNNKVFYEFTMGKEQFEVEIHNSKNSNLAKRNYSLDKLEKVMFIRHKNLRQCGNTFKGYSLIRKDLRLIYG